MVDVTQLATVDKRRLDEHAGRLDSPTLAQVEAGPRFVLALAAA